MAFSTLAATLIGKLAISAGGRVVVEQAKEIWTQRKMQRLVEDAVDRIVQQVEAFLDSEKVSERKRTILINAISAKIEPLVKDPQKFFGGNLDGALIFKQCHPDGELPQEIREESLGQFYSVLFPQIVHFIAGSRIALAEWQAEGMREGFKRLSQLADEISAMNAKVAGVPGAVVSGLASKSDQEAENLLREFSQTLLSNLLLKLDLSPLRAERSLYGSLGDHFVVPAIKERRDKADIIEDEAAIMSALATPSARRIVHGGAGIGKTTCSLWLQSKLLQANPGRLAIVLRLREVKDIEQHSLLELLRDKAGTHLRDAITDKVLRKWHATGRLVVILDGFDEVPEERRDAVQNWICDLAIPAKKTALLITSRPLQSGHLEKLCQPWQQWDLLVFDERRIVEFITRWHKYLPDGELSPAERKVDATALAATFFRDPSLKPLADTPLMLGTLLFVHHRDKKLPNGRVDLYERYFSAMLGLRDSGLGIEARATKLTDREKRRVLAHIALHFHLNAVNEVNDEMMCRLVGEALIKFKLGEKVERLLPALCERSGLLQGPGTWCFMHKTIGEFLVAELVHDGTEHLADKRRLDRKELWVHRHEDAWMPVLFFWAGKTTPRELEEFISDLVNEAEAKANLLALSLLYDQGERLAHPTQRVLALRIVSSQKHTIFHVIGGSGNGVLTAPCVPHPFYQELSAVVTILRGLSPSEDFIAYKQLFDREILTPDDILNCYEGIRGPLVFGAFLHSRTANDRMKRLRVLEAYYPIQEIALQCFDITVIRQFYIGDISPAAVQLATVSWINSFPEGKEWVSLLLVGALESIKTRVRSEHQTSKSIIGALLWARRDIPVADDWLVASDDWRTFARGGLGDVLKRQRDNLHRATTAADWGLTEQQRSELLAWFDRLLVRRQELQAAASQKGASAKAKSS